MSATVAKDKPGRAALLAAIVLSGVLFCGCGGGSTVSSIGTGTTTLSPTPTISTTPAQNGAVIVVCVTQTGVY